MMDAIGNTLQGATAIRGSSQQSVTQTAQPEADPLAGSVNEPSRYYSPVVRIDSETQRTVLQFRDGSDGKVLVQYPSEKQLEAYRSKASTERAKEQEKAEARISGDKDAEAAPAGRDRPDRNRPAGGFADRGPAHGRRRVGERRAAGFLRYPVAQPISIPVSTPRAGASAPSPWRRLPAARRRPVLQSISA